MLEGDKPGQDVLAVSNRQLSLLQGLIDVVPTPIYFRDMSRGCLWYNRAFEKLVGLGREDIVFCDMDTLLFADNLDSMDMLDEMLVSLGGEQNFETTIRGAAGKSHSVAVCRSLYHDAASGVQGIVAGLVDITSRRQVEKNANRALGILNGALESMHDGFVAIQSVNDEPEVVASNNTLAQMFGLPEGLGQDMTALKIVGQSVSEPADYWTKFLNQSADVTKLFHQEIRLKGGQIFEVYSRPFSQGNEVSGRVWNYRDITQERLNQSLLKASNERNQALWYQSSDFIFVFDPDGMKLLEANEKCLATLGYSASDFVDRKITDIMDSDPEMLSSDIRELMNAGSRFFGSRQLIRKNGTRIHTEVATSVITYQSSSAILVNARDISERVRLEDQILADVQLAAKVQRQFLPARLENEWVVVEGIYTPHYSISGDIYSFRWNQAKQELSGFLLDVSGHGIATSLLNAVLLPLAREAMEMDAPLHERVSWMNNQTLAWVSDGSYAAGIFFEVDFGRGEMSYVPAGTGHFLLSDRLGARLVKAPGFMLGLWPQAEYETVTMAVHPGDAVFLLSDGISDLLRAGKLAGVPCGNGFMSQVEYLRELTCDALRQDDASGICIRICKLAGREAS